MKRIQKKLYMGLAVLGLLVPSQVYAAGQDRVDLSQDESDVGVSLEMSNAVEEKITAVSVSLEIKTQGQEQIIVDFQFSPELNGTEHGYVYNEETGRLDIYASSTKCLFEEERLNLGKVQILPADSKKTVSAGISYCQDSFQTANGFYGDKTPVVEGEVASVNIQIGNGTKPPPPDTDTPGGNIGTDPGINTGGNPGNTDTKPGGSTGEDSGKDNRNDGLYDETTQFVNDPANAQVISTEIVKSDAAGTKLVDLTTKVPTGIKTGAGSAAGQVKTRGNVSVVAPKDGPSSIFISKEENEFLTGSQPGNLLGEMSGDGLAKDENMEEIV
ncbi:MAG: hypothetical protein K2N55_12690, partial [Lachnospiraceae bacterium]|nr:hypothetical protein [Lachnospiraceae bacterium]